MDILIKSFNRPYYLDRCLQSIKTFIKNSTYTITILDDGTPEKYLDKIKLKYPEVSILKSDYYCQKSNDIKNDLTQNTTNIPIKLWLEGSKNASNVFLLIEDDMWFTENINLDDLNSIIVKEKIKMLKLYWLGNQKLIPKNHHKKLDLISIYKPNLYTKNPILYYLIFRVYRFKTRKISSFFNIYSDEKALNYYTIFSTAGAIFDKKYFFNLFENHKNTVDEGLQLLNAVKFINKNRNTNFGNTNNEFLKTGFASSATNKIYTNVNLDSFTLNKILNESWYNNNFETTVDFDNDLNYKIIELILEKENNLKTLKTEWQKWVSAFKKQYTDFGCNID